MTAAKEVRGEFRDLITKTDKNIVAGVASHGMDFVEKLTKIEFNPLLNPGSAAIASLALGLTITALQKGKETLESHLQNNRSVRELFEQDYQHHTVSFFSPQNVTDRSSSQHFFEVCIGLLQDSRAKESTLFKYAGIYFSENVKGPSNKRHVIPPFNTIEVVGTRYGLISLAALPLTMYDPSQGDDELLDRARFGGDDVLDTELRIFLDLIHQYEHQSNINAANMQSLPQKTIQRLNLLRSLAIAFANILINLQHPPDLMSESKTQLNDKDAMALCAQMEEVLDKILSPNPEDKNFAYLKNLEFNQEFLKFIRVLKREVQELHEGYQYKLLRTLNLKELVTESRGILQTINATLLKTLYPDGSHNSPRDLRSIIRQISNALDIHPEVWQVLTCLKGKQFSFPGLNQPMSTVVDLIGVFASSSPADRTDMIHNMSSILNQQKKRKYEDLIVPLQSLNKHFIQPLEAMIPKQHNAADSFLLGLLALTIESAPPFLQEATVKTHNKTILEQASALNDQVYSASTWMVLKNKLKPETLAQLRKTLEIAQREFIGAVRTVNALENYLESNSNLLLNADVRVMIKKAADTLELKRSELMVQVTVLTQYANTQDNDSEEQIKNHLKYMNNPDKGLPHRFESLECVIRRNLNILKAPVFVQNVIQDVSEDLSAIYTSSLEFEIDKEKLLSLCLSALQPNRIAASELTESTSKPFLSETTVSVINAETQINLETPNVLLQTNTFKLQILLKIIQAVSAFLILAGVFVFLSTTLGVPYLPIITALSNQPSAACTIASFVSAASGGVGLALSYFFKPEPIIENNARPLALNVSPI